MHGYTMSSKPYHTHFNNFLRAENKLIFFLHTQTLKERLALQFI